MRGAQGSGFFFPARFALAVFIFMCAATPAAAQTSSLVWGNDDGSSPTQIEISDGGTYTVPLSTDAPGYINPTTPGPYTGALYFLHDDGTKDQITTLHIHNDGGDTEFSWPQEGSYELDITPLRLPNFIYTHPVRWLARIITPIAEADAVEILHFIIKAKCTENCYSNVMFLPGIEGSRLYATDSNGHEQKLWEPGLLDNLHDLYLNPQGESVRTDVYTKPEDIINNTGSENIYQSLMDKMTGLKNDGQINDWEPVAYDWRLSLDDILQYGNDVDGRIYYSGDLRATSTPYIIQELRELAATSKTGKVTIIAHSNGGLVAKRLTEILGADASSLIDKMIFVAVPQVGTPDSLLEGLQGEPILYGAIASAAAVRTFATTSPMFYHLLPSAQYFTHVDDSVITFDPALADWIAKYGDTIHSQEELHNFLTDSFGRVDAESGDANQPVQLSDSLLTNAETLHDDLDNWTPPTGVQLIQVAGWGVDSTVKSISYAKKGSAVIFNATTTIDGDGTVVVPSALWVSTSTGAQDYWVDLKTYNSLHPLQTLGGFSPYNHGDILVIDPLLNFISDSITGASKSIDNYQYLSTAAPPSNDINRLHFALHSPLTLNLYDDQGRHTGMSTTTGQLEEQIPGTYYQEIGDVKYLFADADASFHVILEGTGTGTFTFFINEMQGNNVLDSTTFSDIPVTPQTIVTMDLTSGLSSASNLAVDEDGNGTIDSRYASSTGQLIIPPAPVTAPSGGGGGGNGPPVQFMSTVQVISPTTTISVSATTTVATSSEPAMLTATSTGATSTIISTASSTSHVASKKVAAKHIAVIPLKKEAQTKPITQVASAAQSTGGGLWSKIINWIIIKLHL